MGECLRCGRCCTSFGVCITPFDIRRLSQATGLEPGSFVMAIEEPPERERAEPAVLIDGIRSLIVLAWKSKKTRQCIFYSESGCLAYSYRPMLCRTYPFRACGGSLADMKSRACPARWRPEAAENDSYLQDVASYEKELAEYSKIASEWNRRGGGSLAMFLEMAIAAVP